MPRKFSWKKASGLSAAKGKLSREIGVPLTKSGRKKKMKSATGCCVPFAIFLGVAVLVSYKTLVA